MDKAHEVERGALLRGHVEGHLLALLTRAAEHGIAGAINAWNLVGADPVLEELELRRSITVRVGAMRLAERLADRAVVDLSARPGKVLLLHDRHRVRALIGLGVDE